MLLMEGTVGVSQVASVSEWRAPRHNHDIVGAGTVDLAAGRACAIGSRDLCRGRRCKITPTAGRNPERGPRRSSTVLTHFGA